MNDAINNHSRRLYNAQQRKPRAAAPVVAVKGLTWTGDVELIRSATLVGEYFIRCHGFNGKKTYRVHFPKSFVRENFDTLEAAKSAAQADYNARILSALDTAPAAPLTDPRVKRLVGELRIELTSHEDDAGLADEFCNDEAKSYHTNRANKIRTALAAIEAQP